MQGISTTVAKIILIQLIIILIFLDGNLSTENTIYPGLSFR